MKKNSQSGFTLIELLVVIAIIGILASVVLASLNSARTKGANAAVKANLANARAQAELFYDTGSTYTGACATGTTTINSMVQAASTAAGSGTVIVNNAAAQTTTTASCNVKADGSAWAASVPLKSDTKTYYCVDSTGASTGTNTALAAVGTGFVCVIS